MEGLHSCANGEWRCLSDSTWGRSHLLTLLLWVSSSGCLPSIQGQGDIWNAPVSKALKLHSTMTHRHCSQTCPSHPVHESADCPAFPGLGSARVPSLVSAPTPPCLLFHSISSCSSPAISVHFCLLCLNSFSVYRWYLRISNLIMHGFAVFSNYFMDAMYYTYFRAPQSLEWSWFLWSPWGVGWNARKGV